MTTVKTTMSITNSDPPTLAPMMMYNLELSSSVCVELVGVGLDVEVEVLVGGGF
jgi:hypothetical protein